MLKLGKNGGQGIFSTYNIRWVFQYTTSATDSTSTVDYLVNSLGFSKEEAIVASSKVSPFKSTENPQSVVTFFRTNGFNNTQIKKFVSSVPKILSYNVDKTLKPKLEAFKGIGLSGSDLAHVISASPGVWHRSLNGHLLPTLEVLRSTINYNNNSNEFLSIITDFKNISWILSSGVRKRFPLNIALLQSYGFSAENIKKLLLRKSRYFVLDPKCLQAVLVRVEEKIGIPRNSAMFFHGVAALCSVSEESLDMKFEIYKSFGWTESEILASARRNPYTLMLSESKLRSTLSFLIKELGYQPAEIASRAVILTYSLEKRIIPRNVVIKVLKEKKLIKPDYSFLSCLNVSDSKFCNRFVLPFKDKVPGLYDDFMRRVGSPIEAGSK